MLSVCPVVMVTWIDEKKRAAEIDSWHTRLRWGLTLHDDEDRRLTALHPAIQRSCSELGSIGGGQWAVCMISSLCLALHWAKYYQCVFKLSK